MEQIVIKYIKAILRRAWGKSKQRQNALKLAKVSYGNYECAKCKNIYRRKFIQVDHKVAIGKFKDFDSYIERLFCNTNQLQILCTTCHKNKTKSDIKKM